MKTLWPLLARAFADAGIVRPVRALLADARGGLLVGEQHIARVMAQRRDFLKIVRRSVARHGERVLY